MASGSPYRPPTLAGVASMMADSPVQFTAETGHLLAYIAEQHQPPVTCRDCEMGEYCPAIDMANGVGIAWLMQLVDGS